MHPWLTDDVIRLTDVLMAAIDRYDELAPILADALEEGGFNDDEVLKMLRNADSNLNGSWLRPIIYGQESLTEVVAAVDWMKNTAKQMGDTDDFYDGEGEPIPPEEQKGETIEWLMEVCKNFIRTGEDYCFGHTSYHRVDGEELWRNYKILTGESPSGYDSTPSDADDPPHPPDYVPFRCAC